jgi:hypothetical protein
VSRGCNSITVETFPAIEISKPIVFKIENFELIEKGKQDLVRGKERFGDIRRDKNLNVGK